MPVVTMNDIVRALESDLKENGNANMAAQEDLKFLKIMEEGIKRNENARYEMPLPFKERPLLSNYRSMALSRLEHLKRRFKKELKYKEDYTRFMGEVLNINDAEEAPILDNDEDVKWYIRIMVSITQRRTKSKWFLTAQQSSKEL